MPELTGPWLWQTPTGRWEVYARRPDLTTRELVWLRIPCLNAEAAVEAWHKLRSRGEA